MPPGPIDGQVMTPGAAVAMGVPVGPATGTIPLSTLVEYIIQSTYHELTVLSELLPRKSDMERKIEIVQFASKTRQLFVRLLALVKWANSASKVDKCAMISSFLDQQALLFVDTADMLHKMARVTLVRARLPSFSIPCAIDVLTTGTYPRLPLCIKEKIVPPDPITHQEKYQTLHRLTQIIEHRLVTTDLPKHMRRPKIQNGRVVFRVQHEFEVTLTLMGDGANVPWRLLDIQILVEDPDTGGGKALVHSLQVNYIHQLLQARLMDNDRPLDDLYNTLHSFCQSLQLEVLYSQSQRLIGQRLRDHIHVEEYISSKKLVLSYWRNQQKKTAKPAAHMFKLSVFVDEHSPAKPLQISHFPQIQGSESIKVAQTIRSDYLSLEKLLIHTIQIRSLTKLKDLEREFRLIHVVAAACETRDLPTVLYVPVIHPCMTTEKLAISVDLQSGHYLASLCSKEIPITNDIEQSLNGDRRDLRRHLTRLRLWLGLQRCIKSAQQLSVSVHRSLPLVNLSGHPLEKLSRSHLFIRLNKLSHHYLVVECQESRRRQISYNYYLLQAEPSSRPHGGPDTPATQGSATPSSQGGGEGGAAPGGGEELRAAYLKAGSLTQLDTFSCTHGIGSRLYDVEEEDAASLHRKRKLLLGDAATEPPQKKRYGTVAGAAVAAGTAAYFVPDLAHVLALCEDQLPVMELCEELARRGIQHSGSSLADAGAGLAVTILSAPVVSGVSELGMEDLSQCLLSLTLRTYHQAQRSWHVEALLSGCPVQSVGSQDKHGQVQRVFWQYKLAGPATHTVTALLDDWAAVATLYDLVLTFAEDYNGDKYLQSEIEIKSYNYKHLILAYGPNKCYTCKVLYKSGDSQFHLVLGMAAASNITNCHTIMLTQLQRKLNHTRSLAKLAQDLADTWSVLQSLGKLSSISMLGLSQRASQPLCSFSLLPQSPSHIRVSFRQQHCLDIHCRAADRTVAIRDGAYSKFEATKVVDGCNPISGLKAFLNLFVDDTVTSRRRSTVDDDNPPSPLGMDMDTFMATQHQHSTASPGSAHANPRSAGGKYPLTPGSNPHTPASPATSRGSNQPVIAPSPSNMMAPSPSNQPLHHVPSPSSFVPAPSPSSLGIHMPSPAAAAAHFISPQAMVEGGSPAFPRHGELAMTSPSSYAGPSPAPRPHVSAPSPAIAGMGAASVLSPPPARVLPQRAWAASVATVLSHDALARLCTPAPPPTATPGAAFVNQSPLERFLACQATRKTILRTVNGEEALSVAKTNEPGMAVVKTESLQLYFGIHPQTLQSLTLKAQVDSSAGMPWEQEELNVLEKFFELKVAVYPYRTNAVVCFVKFLSMPTRVLKDLVQIMRLELMNEKSLRWAVQLCLTFPHNTHSPANISVGNSMVLMSKGKYLIGLQLTRNGPAPSSNSATALNEIFVSVLYDMATNKTTLPQNRSMPSTGSLQHAYHSVHAMFVRFSDYSHKPSECSLYPAIRDLATNLQLG